LPKERAYFGGEQAATPEHLDRALKLFALAGLWAALLLQAASWGIEILAKG
jgi:cobalamin biosynthesis protein CobD/CbiB